MKFIELENISYKYPQLNAPLIIKDLSFTLNSNEIVQVSGRNGSGKSTLLRIICNELLPSSGKIIVNSETKSVYLNQNSSLFLSDALTVREQLTINLKDRNIKLESILSKYKIGLEERLEEFIGHLSGGQKQIISLISTILSGYNVICLDEFSTAMDSYSKEKSIEILMEYYENKNISIIEVNHNKLSNLPIQKILEL